MILSFSLNIMDIAVMGNMYANIISAQNAASYYFLYFLRLKIYDTL